MPKEYSPFTPGRPVTPESFVGREAEARKLLDRVMSARSGRLERVFIAGERGIGKSSLAKFVAAATAAASEANREPGPLYLHAFLGGAHTLEELTRRVFDCMLQEAQGKGWYDKIRDLFGQHVRSIGLLGVGIEFRPPAEALEGLARGFAPALHNLLQRLQGDKHGLFLVLDDINGLAEAEDFAHWLKSVIDGIAVSGPALPMCLVLVGLEERRQALIKTQASLARVFDIIDVRGWSIDETRAFYHEAFAKVGYQVDEDALTTMARYAGGLPDLAHEIGDAAYRCDTDRRIDREDALNGTLLAAEIVGRKHIEAKVVRAIHSERYRNILRAVTDNPLALLHYDTTFKRSDLAARLPTPEQKVLGNFLVRMKKLGVIRSEEDAGPGVYRFENLLHYCYFWIEAARAKKNKGS